MDAIIEEEAGPSGWRDGADREILIPDKSKCTLFNPKHKIYLSAQKMRMSGKTFAQSFEHFEIGIEKDCSVTFKTYHKTYLRASKTGFLRHTDGALDSQNKFRIEMNPDGTIYLKTYWNYYVSMAGGASFMYHIKEKNASTVWLLDIHNPHHDADQVLSVTPRECNIIEGKGRAEEIVHTSFPDVLLDNPATAEQAIKPKKGSKYFKGSVDYANLPDLYDVTDLMKFPVPIQSRYHGCFMSASKSGSISREYRVHDSELFHIERHPSSSHKVSFRTRWGTYLSVYKDKKLGQSKLRTNNEFFIVRRFGEGVVLQAHNGKYVMLEDDGSYSFAVERIIHTQFLCHGSFSVPRPNIDARFYVDGEEYFSAVCKAMSGALECIYITGWFLSPNIYLIRPNNDPEHILSTILYTCAQKGVKVCILLWNNVESVAPNKHMHAKEYLEGLHSNIHVSLRPHSTVIPSSWSHHQKSVMVDNKIAFVGGLDLCLYRWDTHAHDVVEKVPRTFVGKDYYNGRFSNPEDGDVHRPFDGGVDKTKYPRMPWHDVHLSVDGPACADVVRNFVQRWNHNRIINKIDYKEIASGTGKGEYVCQVVRSISHEAIGHHSVESSIREAYCRTIAEADSFVYIENQYFIDPVSPKLITRAIIDRIKRAVEQKEEFKIVVILPQYPDNGDPTTSSNSLVIMWWQKQTIEAIENEINNLSDGKYIADDYISFYSLRSYGVLGDKIVTEQIYVHSKIVISDKAAVIGSANINARSMLGNRDTELSVLVKGPKFGVTLVRKLIAEHAGIPVDEIPLNLGQFFKEQWHQIAENNTDVFKKVFKKSVPESEPATIAEYKNANEKYHVGIDSLATLQSRVQGHLVLFPTRFLVTEQEGSIVAFKWQFILNAWRKVSDLLN